MWYIIAIIVWFIAIRILEQLTDEAKARHAYQERTRRYFSTKESDDPAFDAWLANIKNQRSATPKAPPKVPPKVPPKSPPKSFPDFMNS